MKKIQLTIVISLSIVFFFISGASADNTVSLQPVSQTVQASSSVSFLVNLDYTENLFTVHFRANYDLDFLDFVGFNASSSILNDLPDCTALVLPPIEISPGVMDIGLGRFGVGCFGTSTGGVVGELMFDSRELEGNATVAFSDGSLSTYDGVDLLDVSGTWIDATITVDNTAPVLEIIGEDIITLNLNSSYIEAGASSTDAIEGDMTANIIIDDSAVETSATGTYMVSYNVSDSAGNSAEELFRTVHVVEEPSSAVFEISNLSHASISQTGAVITWNTNVEASTQVEYGLTSSYGSLTNLDNATTTSHSVSLSGLSPSTSYHYRALSTTDDSQIASSSDMVFTTTAVVSSGGSGGGGGGGGSSVPVDKTPPAQISSSTVLWDDEKIVVSWNNPTNSDFDKVSVIKSTELIMPYYEYDTAIDLGSLVYSGKAETFSDSEISSNITYYYAVFSADTKGNYSYPVVFEKKAFSTNAEGDSINYNNQQNEQSNGSSASYNSLADLPSTVVEKISLNEAQTIFLYNKRVDLNETTVDLYDLIIKKSPHELFDQDKFAIAYFIHTGSQTTFSLGGGERAGVLNSYLSVFGELPQNETEWQDVIKIANGRWPTARNMEAEKKAESSYFKIIFKRNPDMKNPHDNAAVTVITYGLRPANRNMESEKSAIKIFKAILGHNPKSAIDWDITRAIAYSGATR